MVFPKLKNVLPHSDERKKKHAERMRIKRSLWTEAEIIKNREQSRLRMQKMRNERKKKALHVKEKSIPRTRKQIEEENERLKVQREKKRAYRRSLHPQKLRRIREKDRLAKKIKRQKLCENSAACMQPKKQTSRPIEHTQGLEILKESIQNMDGRIQKHKKIFVTRIAESLKRKYGLNYNVTKALGVTSKYLAESTDRKKRKDSVETATHGLILSAYRAEYNSVNIPNVKSLKHDLIPKYVLNKSLRTVYEDFKAKNPEQKVSFSKFASMRPKDVKTQSKRSLVQCLCEYCENVRLKLVCLNKLAAREGSGGNIVPRDVHKAVEMCLCEKENGFYKKPCVEGKCVKCGTKKLADHLQGFLVGDMQVEWSIWDYVQTVNPKTGKSMTKRQIVKRKGTPQLLIAELLEEVTFLCEHLYIATWQQHQFANLNNKVPQDSVVVTADYAENYTCFQQNEIQGAHWAKDSVTIHPTVTRYNCARCQGQIVEEVIDIVSDDLQHDTHAVHVFLANVFNHLTTNRGLDIKKAFLLTDGCAAQYKCKTAFMDASMSVTDFGFEMERGYYGSRHGKNRCDGEGGVIKSAVARAVRNGEALVYNAQMFFEVAKPIVEKKPEHPNGSCNHKRRTVLWVGSDSIDHNRLARNCRTVPGTRKLHSIRGVHAGVILTRSLSCFCDGCLSTTPSQNPCSNQNVVGDWKRITLKNAADLGIQPPNPAVQPPDPVVQPQDQAEQPPDPVAQPLDQVEQPPDPVVQPLDQVEQPPDPVVQPLDQAEQPPDPVVQPLDQVEQPPDPVAQPLDQAEQPPDPVVQQQDQAEQPQDPVAQPLDQVEQQPDPVVQPLDQAEQPPDPVAQPLDQVEQPPELVDQSLEQADQPPDPVVQPLDQVEQPPDPVVQPLDLAEQPHDPIEQPSDPVVQPVDPVLQPPVQANQPPCPAELAPDPGVLIPDKDLEMSFNTSDISIDIDVVMADICKDNSMADICKDNSFDIDIGDMVESVSDHDVMPSDPESKLEQPNILFGENENRLDYQVGDFVLVALSAGKRSIEYAAEIKDVTGDDVLLQYMHEMGKKLYKWPTKTDISQEPITSILKKLPQPTLVASKSSSRRHVFQF